MHQLHQSDSRGEQDPDRVDRNAELRESKPPAAVLLKFLVLMRAFYRLVYDQAVRGVSKWQHYEQ